MPGQNYYLLTALPALGELGSEPPLTGSQLLAKVAESGGPDEIVSALLLADDLLQREALLAGEIDPDRADPAVLSVAQMRDEQPLPEYFQPGELDQAPRIAVDAVWGAYFRHTAALAARTGSAFVRAWVGFEVALRNAVAAERARALGLDAHAYVVAADLADEDADVSEPVAEFSAADSPLAAQRALDLARWRWITEHDAYFTYADDELAAYAARLSLLHRWQRLKKPAER